MTSTERYDQEGNLVCTTCAHFILVANDGSFESCDHARRFAPSTRDFSSAIGDEHSDLGFALT